MAPDVAIHATAELQLLQRIAEAITGHRVLQDVLSALTRGLVEEFGAALARVWMYSADEACPVCGPARRDLLATPRADGRRSLHLCASAGLFEGVEGPNHRLELGALLGGRVAERGEPQLLPDLSAEPRAQAVPWIAGHALRAYAGYPLLFRGELQGVLGVFARSPWSAESFRALGAFAAQAAIAIRSASLLEEADRRHERLSRENAYLHDELRERDGFGPIVGTSPAMRDVLGRLDAVAPTDTTVLLCGETGTGKELLARAVHARSARRDGPFVAVNCGAIPAGLVESELFGHERGAFSGAVARRMGRFELADRGTLFLDEVGELPLEVQVKLLRVLEDGEVTRVGAAAAVRVDVRIVAATHRDLQADVAAGRFRDDLFYRLHVLPIRVPPLRERMEDVPALVEHLLARFERKLRRPLRAVSPAGLERLLRYRWPGNVRELQNVLERACVLARGDVVELAEELAPRDPAPGPAPARSLEEVEREHILAALEATGGVVEGPRGAASQLGLRPSTLRSRLERLGIVSARRRFQRRAGGDGAG